jgi:calcium binding protein 39
VDALARAVEREEIIPQILTHLKNVDFEARKAIAFLFCFFARNDTAGFVSSYLPRHTAILAQMMDGYSASDVALTCGVMVREAVKHSPVLHEALLYGPDGGISKPLHDLFEQYVHDPNFDVASDAFETLSTLLTADHPLVLRWLDPSTGNAAALARYSDFFQLYNKLLQSDNYVLKRQSLKLLSEFLLDRTNFALMLKYISDRNNLRVIMTLLRHKQPNVQFEAFHVFKVFVANPTKPKDIADILAANKGKLVAFLQSFQNEKDDEQFIEEKAMLIDTLQRMPDVPQ